MNKKTKLLFWVSIVLLLGFMYLHTRGQRELCLDVDSLQFNGGYSEGTYQVFDEKNEKGTVCQTYDMILNEGKYVIRVNYSEQFVPNIVRLDADGEIFEYELPVEQTSFEFPVTLTKGVRRVNIAIEYQRTGKLTITSIEIIGEKLLYTDTIFLMLLVGLCAIFLYFFFYQFFCGLSMERKMSVILMCGAVFISCIPLMESGLPKGHDIGWHIQRMEGVKEALLSGQFPVRIAPNENQGYGLLLTQYPFLFMYMPAVLRIFNVSPVGAYKTLVAFINIAATASIYFCGKSLRNHTDERSELSTEGDFHWGPTTSAVVFCLFPYRLINIYTRAAIGEALAMIFLPILLTGLYHVLVGNYKKWYLIVLGATGVLNSHIISTLLAMILAVSVIIIWCRKLFEKSRMMAIIKASILTVLINCSYLVPFLYFYYTKATRVSNIFKLNYVKETIEFKELFMKGSTFNAAALKNPVLGLAGAVCLLLIVFGFLICKNEEKKPKHEFMISLFWLMIIFVFAATSVFPYKQLGKITLVDKIMPTLQFPYRFISIVTVLCALLIGYIVTCNKSMLKNKGLITIAIFVILLMGTFDIFDSMVETDSFYRMEYSNGMYIDYIPEGADNSILSSEVLKSADDTVVIENYVKHGNRISFDYESTDGAFVDLPLYFYPGYAAETSDGESFEVSSGENMSVRVALPTAEDKKTVNVFYRESILFRVSELITLITLLLCAVYILRINNYGAKFKSF